MPQHRYHRLAAALITVTSFGVLGLASGEERRQSQGRSEGAEPPHVAPVADEAYRRACGDCHMAYQPGLLPTRSWQRLLAGLHDHFSERVTLEPAAQEGVRSYLLENAADQVRHRLPRHIMRSLHDASTPLRVSELPYLVKEHRWLPPEAVHNNDEVRSFSRCSACHTRAGSGSYDENEIRIPGWTESETRHAAGG